MSRSRDEDRASMSRSRDEDRASMSRSRDEDRASMSRSREEDREGSHPSDNWPYRGGSWRRAHPDFGDEMGSHYLVGGSRTARSRPARINCPPR